MFIYILINFNNLNFNFLNISYIFINNCIINNKTYIYTIHNVLILLTFNYILIVKIMMSLLKNY